MIVRKKIPLIHKNKEKKKKKKNKVLNEETTLGRAVPRGVPPHGALHDRREAKPRRAPGGITCLTLLV